MGEGGGGEDLKGVVSTHSMIKGRNVETFNCPYARTKLIKVRKVHCKKQKLEYTIIAF